MGSGKKTALSQLIRFAFVVFLFSMFSALIPGLGFHSIWGDIWGLLKNATNKAAGIFDRTAKMIDLVSSDYMMVETDQVLRSEAGIWDKSTHSGVIITPLYELTIREKKGKQVHVTFQDSDGILRRGWVNEATLVKNH